MKPPTACRHLNNKAYFFPPPVIPRPPLADGTPPPEPDPPSTPFWCLKTFEPTGPDGGHVSHQTCGPHRPCFQPEVEL